MKKHRTVSTLPARSLLCCALAASLFATTPAMAQSSNATLRGQVASAQSKLTAAQDALGQASLTSSIAGTVAAVNVAVGETVRIRLRQDLPGPRMYHCHILEHEDAGMMGQFTVT